MNMTIVKLIIEAGRVIIGDENISKVLLGTYSDGSNRSIADSLSGEFISPKDRENMLKKAKKKENKKKNKLK